MLSCPVKIKIKILDTGTGSVVDRKLLFRIRIPFSCEFRIRILLDCKKVSDPVSEPTQIVTLSQRQQLYVFFMSFEIILYIQRKC
jgi:hypothetical protein